MSERQPYRPVPLFIYNGFCFISLVVLKAFGSSLITWSWWWLFLPWVPVTYLLLGKAGLL